MNDFAISRTGARSKCIFRFKNQHLFASQCHGTPYGEANNASAHNDRFDSIHIE
jgi:hypothetical protein